MCGKSVHNLLWTTYSNYSWQTQLKDVFLLLTASGVCGGKRIYTDAQALVRIIAGRYERYVLLAGQTLRARSDTLIKLMN